MSNSKKLIITVVLVCIAAFVFLNTDASQLNVSNLDQTLDLTGQAFDTTCKSNADCSHGSTCEISSRNGIGTCSFSRASFQSRIISQRNILNERVGAEKTIAESLCLQKGCYDTDPSQDIFKSGKLFFRKEKSDGEQYCTSSKDSCKQLPNGKWMVTQHLCSQMNIPGQDIDGFEVKQTLDFCEGLCAYGACLPATCDDGIQNQGETEIDCGGPCDSCTQTYCDDPTGFTPLENDGIITKDVNGNDVTLPDKCLTKNILKEMTCDGNEITYEEVGCACDAGACKSYTYCKDPDGLDFFTKTNRTITTDYGDYQEVYGSVDRCVPDTSQGWIEVPSSKYIFEFACVEEEGVESYSGPCPEGSWCFDGACEYVECIDSDNSNEYNDMGMYEVGSTTGFSGPDSESYETKSDECKTGAELLVANPNVMTQYPNGMPVDPNKEYLVEHSCINSINMVANWVIECEHGCFNGACLEFACEESDGGYNLFEKGTATGQNPDSMFGGKITMEDSCSSSTQIVETYCENGKLYYGGWTDDPLISSGEKCPEGFTCSDGVCVSPTCEVVQFADPNIEAEVRNEINKPTGILCKDDVLEVVHLVVFSKNVEDLSGIEHLENLEYVNFNDNDITDLSPLESLPNIYLLYLSRNNIVDLSPLESLTTLEHLIISENPIEDYSPISTLPKLRDLGIGDNSLVDINFLSSIISLEDVYLADNEIIDLTPLGSLSNLEEINILYNEVTDISPLTQLPNLDEVHLHYNPLSQESCQDVELLVANGVEVHCAGALENCDACI